MVTEVFKGRSGSPLHLQAIGPVVVARLRQTDSARRVLAQASVFPPPVEVSLLIDTGASISFIQRHIPLVLGLRPMREEDVRTADHKVVRCPVYLATLELPLRRTLRDLVDEGARRSVLHDNAVRVFGG